MPPPWLWPRAAYIHVPFCAFHCGYCDFAVAVGHDGQIDRYLQALGRELSRLGAPQPIDTLFFGGGTPTHLSPVQLERLLSIVLRWLPLNPGHEFSVEANPGTLTPEKIAVLAEHGVNRLSLGAQSFDPELLKRLERDHAPADVFRAVDEVRRRIPAVSLDLIFGVPGQTLDLWRRDLEQALALGPEHLATYGLTYEKGTRLWKQRARGAVVAQSEDAELAMYTLAMETLESAGFEHYEISNFARPGQRCRHNQVYWANHAYFGFGLGAARYIEGVRELNTRDLHAYLTRDNPTFQSERLPPRDRALETLAVHLRRADGVCRGAFLEQTGFDVDALRGGKIAELTALGLLRDDGDALRLTRGGKCVADAIVTQLLVE